MHPAFSPLTVPAYAKLNLTLDLTRRLPDGYHAIHTVMQTVSLANDVTLSPGDGLKLICDAPGVPADARNTAFKAAQFFCDAIGETPAVTVAIRKRIPDQAGLAGGSADAAAVLRGLNQIYGFPLDMPELLKIALKIGADVPFCLTGGTHLCLNKGEILSRLEHIPFFVTIAKPKTGTSTAEAFRAFDSGAQPDHPDTDLFLYHYAAGDPDEAFRYAGNVFEQLAPVPEGEMIKRTMYDRGALYAAMSGSGSAFFGLFTTREQSLAAADALSSAVSFTAACETVG
ncbi:MAG: 4-(cytidine 5'-diphospho)-2-C-methyl-D-erythritol kinase [Clostridia bacterium]|nr:4-(cytidine 5'-diphospho)-2-C-methyl-D-erythritol kinase [Clostridia bacterium]